MSIRIISKQHQAKGSFNNGEIIENKPLGFSREGGELRPYSSIFYWANAIAKTDSTIGLHPHQGFEIMSFVLEGSIRHYDTQLQDWKELHAGDAQVIRSRSGISHAEHMTVSSRMFQIWLDPDISKAINQNASYSDYKFNDIPKTTSEDLVISHYAGDKGVMQLDTPNINIQKWDIKRSVTCAVKDEIISIYILEGTLSINGEALYEDDFAVIEDDEITIGGEGTVFVIISPSRLSYATYGELMQTKMNRR